MPCGHKMKTFNSLPRYTIVMLQFAMIALLWARVEQVAIRAEEATGTAQMAMAIVQDVRRANV